MFLKDFIYDNIAGLQEVYAPEEARALVLRLCRDVLGTESYTHVIEPETLVPEDRLPFLREAVRRLLREEPLQYILGYEDFAGYRFNVTPAVLIPRPETEELCREAVAVARGMKREKGELRILDLCTGSGCIAWTLALSVPGAVVVGADVSEDALEVAMQPHLQELAAGTGAVPPEFVRYDVLKGPDGFAPGMFDMILSNPPYIRESEKSMMRKNVLDYEPELALFMPDDDFLIFFEKISEFAKKRLNPGGFAMVEINEALEGPTSSIFSAGGFAEIESEKDFRAKFRFIKFKKQA